MTDRKIDLPKKIKEKKFDKRKKKDKEQPEKVAVEIYGSAPISLLQSGCTLNELKAYIAIDSFQGAGDLAFPKVEQLAKRAGMSVSACSMAISRLEENGWVFRKRNYGRANSYVCLVSAMTLDELNKKNSRVGRIEEARKNIGRYSEKQNDPEHSEKQNVHATEKQNEQHFEKQGDEHSEKQNVGYSEKQNDILKDQYKRSLEKNNIKDQETPSPSLPEKPEIPSQTKYDAFKAEYESLFLFSQKVKSESNRQGFALEQLADKLDYSLDSLRLLFSNFAKSWYGTKKIRPNPEKMLKFLTDNSDSLSSDYKGEVQTDRYRDENGKYTNQDGASEYYKREWEEKYQKAIQKNYTQEELEEAARIF